MNHKSRKTIVATTTTTMIQPGIVHVHRALNVTLPFELHWQNDAIPWWSILLLVLPSLFWLWFSRWPAKNVKLHPIK
jgi:hypothetical protein